MPPAVAGLPITSALVSTTPTTTTMAYHPPVATGVVGGRPIGPAAAAAYSLANHAGSPLQPTLQPDLSFATTSLPVVTSASYVVAAAAAAAAASGKYATSKNIYNLLSYAFARLYALCFWSALSQSLPCFSFSQSLPCLFFSSVHLLQSIHSQSVIASIGHRL